MSSNGLTEGQVAELSRLRAFAMRVGPVVAKAIELRELGRTLEAIELAMTEQRIRGDDGFTRSGTPWIITKQAYDTALEEFDKAVKQAAIGDFRDLVAAQNYVDAGRRALQGGGT